MDDLSQQINQILSDPQSMQQLQSMASALGIGGQSQSPPSQPAVAPANVSNGSTSGFDVSTLAGMLNALGAAGGTAGTGRQSAPAPTPSGPVNGITPEALQLVSRIGPLLSQVNREDDSTRLLRALRPLLGAARQKKLDEAIKILQMMRLLPLLKDSGLFSGALSRLL